MIPAAIEPERLDHLPDSDPGQLRVPTQRIVGLLLEQVELRRALNDTKRQPTTQAQGNPDPLCSRVLETGQPIS
jgi:hypothetical protein